MSSPKKSKKVNNSKNNDNFSFEFVVYKDELSDCSENSDNLEIDETPSPKKRKRKCPPELEPKEKAVLENIEEEIERQLDENAANSNMSAKNVKTILRHIITNEQVLALVRHSVNDEPFKSENLVFEPKFTRAKVKELFKNQSQPKVSQKSEVHVLIDQELPEDEEDEEYVPGEDESDDDRDTLNQSDLDSQPATPATPSSSSINGSADCGTQTSWTEDGLFKMPVITSQQTSPNKNNEENIALRTRSKFSLSDTPLESIEQAFIPPDITTDMYDIECDDEDWSNFLKEFTRPLQAVTIGNGEDDEDADPEYNILADEDIEKVDKEELRADKGVKVTKRELNDLVAELFEFDYFDDLLTPSCPIDSTDLNLEQSTINEETTVEAQPETDQSTIDDTNQLENPERIVIQPVSTSTQYVISAEQIMLLEQQIRQHIQLLTQNFLQVCIHPYYSHLIEDFKQMFNSLAEKVNANSKTILNAFNFKPAFNLAYDWEQKWLADDSEADDIHRFVQTEMEKYKSGKKWNRMYRCKFPKYFLETVSESDIFIYPFLLPSILFIPEKPNSKGYNFNSEDELIAIGLEQFLPYMEKERIYRKGRVQLRDACHLISQYMMPSKDPNTIYARIQTLKDPKANPNPIQYYFKYKVTSVTLHYVIPSTQLQFVPVNRQPKEVLPEPWKSFVYPKSQEKKNATKIHQENLANIKILLPPLKRVQKPPTYNRHRQSKYSPKTKKISPQYIKLSPVTYKENSSRQFINTNPINGPVLIHTSPILYLNQSFNSNGIMLPSMPILCTPVKINNVVEPLNVECNPQEQKRVECTPESSNSLDASVDMDKGDNCTISEENVQKDDEAEMNALMKASSTVKIKPKVTASAKKKAKQQKEYETAVALLSPENPKVTEEKAKNYAQAYISKVKERLTHDSPEEYNLFLATLSDHDESVESVTDLYSKVTAILSPQHPDLCEEFITFLTPAQAKEIEKLIPHTLYTKMATFLRKLETYYSKQPAQIRKVYNSLIDLSKQKDVSMDVIKSTILPLLKGNNLLIDYFLQIFPCEKPPESLMCVWEEIDGDSIGNKNMEVDNGECVENINIPDVNDPYGSNSCICSCHNSSEEDYSLRNKHCIPCGTKFIQGKVFIQTGKGPRPATVTFPGSSIAEQSKRLSATYHSYPAKRRADTASPVKNILISPTKYSHESDDECNLTHFNKHLKNSPKNTKITKSPKSVTMNRKLTPFFNTKTETKSRKISVGGSDDNIDGFQKRSIKSANLLEPKKSLSNKSFSLSNKLDIIKMECNAVLEKDAQIYNDCVEKDNTQIAQEKSNSSQVVENNSSQVTNNNTENTETVSNEVESSTTQDNDIESNKNKITQDNNCIATQMETDTTQVENNVAQIEVNTEKTENNIPATIEMNTEQTENTVKAEESEIMSHPFHEDRQMELDECNASIESIELKLSPDRSVGSYDTCEESSQDLSEGPVSESENDSIVENEESYHSESSSSDNQEICSSKPISVPSSSSSSSALTWTRDEDKIILKTFQQKRDSENTFEIIGQLLPQRTIGEIRERFQTLINLLLKHRKSD